MKEVCLTGKVNYKRVLYFGISFFLMIGIFLWVKKTVNYFVRQYQSVSVRLSEEGIDITELEKALEEEKGNGRECFQDIVLWKQKEKQTLKNESFQREERAFIIQVYGSMELAAPMELIKGSYVYQEDKKGCVLDEKTAYSLFGDRNVIGNQVCFEKEDYLIRGVVKTKESLFLYQGKEQEKSFYSNMEISFSNKKEENRKQKIMTFLNQYGWDTDVVVIDGIAYSRMLKHMELLPYWMIEVSFFFMGCRYIIKENKFKKKVKILFFFFMGAFLFGILMWLGLPFYLPEEFIPTRWSDFDFWRRKTEELTSEFSQIRYRMPTIKDVVFMDQLIQSVLGIFGCILSFPYCIHLLQKEENPRHL